MRRAIKRDGRYTLDRYNRRIVLHETEMTWEQFVDMSNRIVKKMVRSHRG